MKEYTKQPLTYQQQVDLLDEYKAYLPIEPMGFTNDWKEEILWQ